MVGTWQKLLEETTECQQAGACYMACVGTERASCAAGFAAELRYFKVFLLKFQGFFKGVCMCDTDKNSFKIELFLNIGFVYSENNSHLLTHVLNLLQVELQVAHLITN